MDYAGSGNPLDFAPSAALAISIAGPALRTNAAGAMMSAVATPAQNLIPPITVFYAGGRLSASGSANATLFSSELDSNSAPYSGWNIGLDGSGTKLSSFFGLGGSWTSAVGATLLSASGFYTAAGRANASFTDVWLNGKQDGTGGANATGITYTASHISLGADWVVPTRNSNSLSLAGYVWNRSLTDAELVWLNAEPFAAFRTRPTRRYYISTSAGPFVFTLGKATWAAAPTIAANAHTLVTLAKATWAWATTSLSTNAHTAITLAKATWAWAAPSLAYNPHSLVTLAQATWAWAGGSLGYTQHYLTTLAKATWAWGANALTYTIGGPFVFTLAKAGWNWAANMGVAAAGMADDYWRMVTSAAHSVARSVMRNN